MEKILVDRDDLKVLLDIYLSFLDEQYHEYSNCPSVEDLEFARRIDSMLDGKETVRIDELEKIRVVQENRRQFWRQRTQRKTDQ